VPELTFILLAAALAQPEAPPLPADWTMLPRFAFTTPLDVEPEVSIPVMEFYQRRPECRTGAQTIARGMRGFRVEMAVLLLPDGRIGRIEAAPTACTAIRNHARALVNRRYPGHFRPPAGDAPVWYQTSITFSWSN
jgi:hypothetical protein